jgi:uncharacterized protein YwqG
MQDRARAALKRAGLSSAATSTAITLLRNSLRMALVATPDAKLAVGTSKIGGAPDLPVGTNAPDLGFIAQINLSYVSGRGLDAAWPPGGLLSFFYDTENEPFGFDPTVRCCVVRLSAPGERLVRAPVRDMDRLRSCAIKFQPEVLLPPIDSSDVAAIVPVEKMVPGADGERYVYLLKKLSRLGLSTDEIHRLGGYPDPVQGDMQLECQLVSNGIYCGDSTGYADPRRKELESGATDWILLLQVDTDDAVELSWADGGRLYFWIRRQDLANRCFDSVRAILQSH